MSRPGGRATSRLAAQRRLSEQEEEAIGSSSDDGASLASEVERETGLKNGAPHALSVGVTFLQVLALIGQTELSWPASVKQTYEVIGSLVAVNLNLVAGECALTSFYIKYLFALSLPLLFVITSLLAILLVKALIALRVQAGSPLRMVTVGLILERVLLVVFPLIYLPVALTSLQLFDCTASVDGKYYLDVDPSIACFDSAWWLALPCSLASCALFVVGFPTYTLLAVYTRRRRLREAHVVVRFGLLYYLFRDALPFFFTIQLLFRLAVVAVILFFSSIQVWLLTGCIALFGGYCGVLLRHTPFRAPLYNRLELRLNLSSAAIIIAGMAFWADDWPNDTSHTVFTLLTLAVIAFALSQLIWVGGREVLRMP